MLLAVLERVQKSPGTLRTHTFGGDRCLGAVVDRLPFDNGVQPQMNLTSTAHISLSLSSIALLDPAGPCTTRFATLKQNGLWARNPNCTLGPVFDDDISVTPRALATLGFSPSLSSCVLFNAPLFLCLVVCPTGVVALPRALSNPCHLKPPCCLDKLCTRP